MVKPSIAYSDYRNYLCWIIVIIKIKILLQNTINKFTKEFQMKRQSILSIIAIFTSIIFSSVAHAMCSDEGKAIVKPFYEFLSNPTSQIHLEAAKKNFHPEWVSFYSNEGYKTLDETMGSIQYFGKLIPDLKWEIKEVITSGNKVIVRGEATGTPVGEFFGVQHTGKSFKIMSIDVHEIKEGKVIKSHHIEDWAGAIKQLTMK